MIAAYLPEYKIMHKYFAIQLVLILYKLQPALIHVFCFGVETLAGYRISSKIIENGKIIASPVKINATKKNENYEILFSLIIFNSNYSTDYTTGNHSLIILC